MSRDVLFVVDGDILSQQVEQEARDAHFSGEIITLSMAEARLQRTPLPLLVTADASYGPFLAHEFFHRRR